MDSVNLSKQFIAKDVLIKLCSSNSTACITTVLILCLSFYTKGSSNSQKDIYKGRNNFKDIYEFL